MIAIINAKILTVTNGTIENGALLVEDGKIAGYGADIQIPENAEIIDAKGGWLTPGLIDAHTLMCVFGEPNTMPGLQGDGNEGSSPITP
ncbi:MAG: amidohydrolase, partial [Clostridia bacterium]|nr:amidohydrolase [Clostridia bacterium]